jgi:hypothetical protein
MVDAVLRSSVSTYSGGKLRRLDLIPEGHFVALGGRTDARINPNSRTQHRILLLELGHFVVASENLNEFVYRWNDI